MPPKPKPTTLPSTTQQLAEVFTTATRAIEDIISSNPESREPIQKLIDMFLANPTVAKLQGAAQAPSPSKSPLPSLLKDVKSIKSTLAALQKVITPSSKTGKPPPSKTTENAPSAPNARAKGKIPTPTFASAAALPPHPSIVVSLRNLIWNKGRPSPANLCAGINGALKALARMPDECHAALVLDNPSYAALNISQKPSWVHDPNSYPEGAVSSLVVAFNDPDGSLARDLLTKRALYAFGHCTTLRKWKQRLTTSTSQPEHANITPTLTSTKAGDNVLLSAIFKAGLEDADTPCSEGPETSKNTKDNDGRQKTGGGKGRDRPTRTPC
ncbi:hypothetical protein EI94DRAFT_1697612 [Lactarius quietus]|nr:hypothetical protein EI94DRAFT_1697612 [Lactarius quietus]